jgi:hypothetical protein
MRVVIIICSLCVLVSSAYGQYTEFCEKQNDSCGDLNAGVTRKEAKIVENSTTEWESVKPSANSSGVLSEKILTLDDLKPNGDYFLLDENTVGVSPSEEGGVGKVKRIYSSGR